MESNGVSFLKLTQIVNVPVESFAMDLINLNSNFFFFFCEKEGRDHVIHNCMTCIRTRRG